MLIYDVEIKKAILGKNEMPQEGIEHCGGWGDHVGMGISCVCCYDYEENRYRVFCDDNLEMFFALIDFHDVIVSFNGIGFDNKVLAHAVPDFIHHERELEWLNEKSYDIFAEIRDGGGGWCGLDAMVKANGLAEGKTGSGAMAPVWYQSGQWGKLVDYCLEDVRLTKKLLDMIIADQSLISSKNSKQMILKKP